MRLPPTESRKAAALFGVTVPAGASDVNASKHPTTRIFAPTDLMEP
jgi:hypothetical protein